MAITVAEKRLLTIAKERAQLSRLVSELDRVFMALTNYTRSDRVRDDRETLTMDTVIDRVGKDLSVLVARCDSLLDQAQEVNSIDNAKRIADHKQR